MFVHKVRFKVTEFNSIIINPTKTLLQDGRLFADLKQITQQRNVNIGWHGCQIEMANKGEGLERSMFRYVAANVEQL
jgi:hypothetical protein